MIGSVILDRAEIESIARALAESEGGLTHSEISALMADCHLPSERIAGESKVTRLVNAFIIRHNLVHNDAVVFEFIRLACKPTRYVGRRASYDSFRTAINLVLSFKGLAVSDQGQIVRVKIATTLSESEKRASDLRVDLISRRVHDDILRFCRAELLHDNYFHAVLEATKSVSEKITTKTYIEGDGATLIQEVFGGSDPRWAINPFLTLNHKKEQSGFCNLMTGIFGMFRNPAAHEAKINWPIEKEDAEDLFSILSLAHRRIDKAWMRPRQ
ncbi:TIGR02391 family protein [soil metagenome]